MNVATRSSKHVMALLQKGVAGRSVMIGGLNNTIAIGGFDNDNNNSTNNSINKMARSMATRARGGSGFRRKQQAKSRVPTMDIAMAMPLTVKEMSNSEVVTLGAMGNSDARREILVRHIMTVDNVNYDTARGTFDEIAAKNREGMWSVTIPYKVGISVAVIAAVGSLPMVFDLTTVEWFNELYVTADLPEPKDLETALEVGSWSWNWMEPALGTASFVLLCLQYIRAQIDNIGIRPYTEKVMASRAITLAAAFPQYNAQLIKNFAESIEFYDDKHGIKLPMGK